MRRPISLALAVFTFTLAPATSAQVITGRVLADSISQQSVIPGAEVTVRQDTLTQRVITDVRGRFRFVVLPGKFQIIASAMGFAQRVSDTLVVKPSERVLLDVVLSPDPAKLAPVVVRARQTIKLGRLGFDYRKERARNSGIGIILDQDDLARTNAIFLSDALRRSPRLRNLLNRPNNRGVTTISGTPYGGATGCHGFKYFVDGTLTTLDSESVDGMFDVSELKGVEVYWNPAEVPGEFSAGPYGCPVLALWTR